LRFPKEFIASFAAAIDPLTAALFEVFSVPPNQPKVNNFQAFEVNKKGCAWSRIIGPEPGHSNISFFYFIGQPPWASGVLVQA